MLDDWWNEWSLQNLQLQYILNLTKALVRDLSIKLDLQKSISVISFLLIQWNIEYFQSQTYIVADSEPKAI